MLLGKLEKYEGKIYSANDYNINVSTDSDTHDNDFFLVH